LARCALTQAVAGRTHPISERVKRTQSELKKCGAGGGQDIRL
jgi:hypothetical protein